MQCYKCNATAPYMWSEDMTAGNRSICEDCRLERTRLRRKSASAADRSDHRGVEAQQSALAFFGVPEVGFDPQRRVGELVQIELAKKEEAPSIRSHPRFATKLRVAEKQQPRLDAATDNMPRLRKKIVGENGAMIDARAAIRAYRADGTLELVDGTTVKADDYFGGVKA